MSRLARFFDRTLKRGLSFRELVLILNKSKIGPYKVGLEKLAYSSIHSKRKRLLKELFQNDLSEINQPLDDLKNHGFCEISNLVSRSDLEKLDLAAKELLQKSNESDSMKTFWKDYMSNSGMEISEESPWTRFLLKEITLKLIGEYLGELPFLSYVLLTESLPQKEQDGYKVSQLWHKDFDHLKMCKLFVYLSDVNDREDGPFTLVSKQTSKKIGMGLVHKHLSDAEMTRRHGGKEFEKIEMIRPKFSVFIADTNQCYHMGSRVLSNNHRLLFTALFTTWPNMYGKVKSQIQLAKPDYRFKQVISPDS